MRGFRSLLAACAGGLFLAGAAFAQPLALDDLFEAAERGETAPAARALADGQEPDAQAVLRAVLASARLRPGVDDDPDLARIAADESRPELRRAALTVLTSAAFLDGDYGQAAGAGRRLEQALIAAGETERAAEAARTHALAAMLADFPRQAIDGAVAPGAIPAHYDRVGLPRIEIVVNGLPQEAVVDTGANLSVLSLATARRFGLEVLDGETPVGNGVDGTVPVRVGVADRVEVAGTLLRNVAFLVIDDEQLTFPIPGGYDIRAIVGLPVLRALGRIRMENGDGRFVVEPAAGAHSAPPNLSASGNDLFAEVEIDGETLPLHLDTGANLTRLSARYAAARPDRVARLATAQSRTASAGGARADEVATWRSAPLRLGGRDLALDELTVDLPGEEELPRFHGTLGSNALRAFDHYIIDFRTMRLDLGDPASGD